MHSNLAGEKASGLQSDFDGVIEAFRQASRIPLIQSRRQSSSPAGVTASPVSGK
jgi:hypothetical protein